MKRALLAVVAALAACGTVVDTSLPTPPGGIDAGADGGADTGSNAPDADLPVADAAVDSPADAGADARPDVSIPDSSTGKLVDAGTIEAPIGLCVGAFVFCDDFEKGARPEWQSVVTAQQLMNVGPSLGGNAAIANVTASPGRQQSMFIGTSDPLDISFRFRIVRKPNVIVYFFRLERAIGEALLLSVDPDLKLEVWAVEGGTPTAKRQLFLPSGTDWLPLRLHADFHPTIGHGELFFDGNVVAEGRFDYPTLDGKPTMTLGAPDGADVHLEFDDVLIK